ncbi:C1 family peptidase [Levilactobacillus bambusae]|uniref:Aminopeptidase n=1 Tax=Levilactobacillus bambusae TaxID=2024736 RepID=A0A2V1MZU4_9LACO|nr:C1 family peptidase [Levilactobacillus bambusae]PWG00541.1 aminopeptidase [Levilactobacillus bambusae]
MSEKALTQQDIQAFHQDLATQPAAEVIGRAVQTNGVLKASEDPKAATRLNRTFSVELDTGTVSNQKHSGRCWLFSTLNTLRHTFAKENNVKDFELSQSYLFFWDKVERANMFYQRTIDLADKPLSDREVSFYMGMPDDDGGQWAMCAALIQKYGVVPSYAMPETFNTDNTTGFAAALNRKLRRDALILRQMVADRASDAEIATKRQGMMTEVYRMAVYSIGEPPTTFDLEFKDDDHKLHRDRQLTPLDFFNKYWDVDLDDYVVVTNSPDKPFNKLYSLPSQDNVLGGKRIEFFNTDMATLKQTAIDQLKDGESVWFGNDIMQEMSREKGYMDSQLYQQAKLFNVEMTMSKAERFETHEAEVTHAMTLTGVDLVDNQPQRWKVENSWGTKVGDKGYFVMTDDWMDDFGYEVVVHKKYLTPEQQAVLTTTPQPLDAWDPLM